MFMFIAANEEIDIPMAAESFCQMLCMDKNSAS